MRAYIACFSVATGVAVACGGNNNSGEDGGAVGIGGDASTTDSGPTVDKCHVPPDGTGDNAPTCTMPPAPPSSFDPVLKWSWTDPSQRTNKGSEVTPLVANLTDDDGNG